jgi:hypothetical protein
MSPREVQRAAGAWLLEASVLVAILPIVDQAVSDGGVTWKMALLAYTSRNWEKRVMYDLAGLLTTVAVGAAIVVATVIISRLSKTER